MEAEAGRGSLADRHAPFRRLNEGILLLEEGSWPKEHDFVCECQDESCFKVLRLPVAEYESVRSARGEFLVLPGHEQPFDERVVRRASSYLVVRPLDELEAALRLEARALVRRPAGVAGDPRGSATPGMPLRAA